MTVMCIGAHPDDEISAGGTLIKHTRAGDRVVVVTVTDGGMGHRTLPVPELLKLRQREAQAAAEVLGAELRMLGYPDGAVPRSLELVHHIARIIRQVKPDIVLTHSRETLHPDHNTVQQAAVDAVFAASLPLLELGHPAHNVPLTLLFAHSLYKRHDVYVDIRESIEAKIQAAGCHASQYEDWLTTGGCAIDGGWEMGYQDSFRMEARVFGGHCGIEYAEAFDYLSPPDPVALPKLTHG
ncbi:MAG TPA: PIG-L deacetylase family protein [Armatimonadota bacterium]|jgi:LmbE family N-acetylglucosaminyl deacetylase